MTYFYYFYSFAKYILIHIYEALVFPQIVVKKQTILFLLLVATWFVSPSALIFVTSDKSQKN